VTGVAVDRVGCHRRCRCLGEHVGKPSIGTTSRALGGTRIRTMKKVKPAPLTGSLLVAYAPGVRAGGRPQIGIAPHKREEAAAWRVAIRGSLVWLCSLCLLALLRADGATIRSGESASGRLSGPGGKARFDFTAGAGETITVAVGEAVGSDPWFEPKLTLYGPDGAPLGSSWGSSGASVARRTMLSGNHYAVIEDSQAEYSGNYWFRMTDATQPQIPWDSWEPFLTFPIPGYGPYANRLATAVFDHHSLNKLRHESVTTEEDDVVEAFNGERGEKRFGEDGSAAHPGYQ